MKTLFEAIEGADAGAVWKLAKEGTAMSAVDETTGLTPLAIAAEAGLSEIVRTLLEAGADANLGGATTPLEAAVVGGHLDVVEVLLEKSADVNQKVEGGFTPLMTAAAIGNLPMVRTLLAAGASPRLLNDDRESAISLAESAGHDEVVEELKEAGRQRRAANVEARRKEQAEAAEEAGHVAAAEEAEAGAATGSDNRGANLLDRGDAGSGDSELGLESAGDEAGVAEPEPMSIVVGVGMPQVGDSDELFGAADEGVADSLALPVGEDHDPLGDELFGAPAENLEQEPEIAAAESSAGWQDEPWEVVDDFSVSLGDFEELLIRFHELAAAGSTAEFQQLVAEQRDFTDSAGRTLLMAAAYQGEAELVRALIGAEADINVCDRTESGRAALVYAVQSPAPERLEILSSLVAAGADVNQRCGRNRRSPLMYAADADVYLDRPPEPAFAQTTKELIRLGANLEARDRRGRTVWRLIKRDAIGAPTASACRRRLHQMLRVLEYNGAQQIASHRM